MGMVCDVAAVRAVRSAPWASTSAVAATAGMSPRALRKRLPVGRGRCDTLLAELFARSGPEIRALVARDIRCPPSLARRSNPQSAAVMSAGTGPGWWFNRDATGPGPHRSVIVQAASAAGRNRREHAAFASGCSALVLGRLAGDAHHQVRELVAASADCPTSALHRLAEDPHQNIRQQVAANPPFRRRFACWA